MIPKIVIICVLVSASYASMFDRCTHPPALESFDESKINGNWYMAAYKGVTEKEIGKCFHVYMNATNGRLHQRITTLVDGKKSSMDSDFSYFKSPIFYSNHEFEPVNWLQKLMGQRQKVLSGRLIAIENEYVIYYTCNQFDPWVSVDHVFIVTKSPTPSNALVMDILKAYSKFGFDGDELGVVDHSPATCKDVNTDLN